MSFFIKLNKANPLPPLLISLCRKNKIKLLKENHMFQSIIFIKRNKLSLRQI